MYLHVIDHFRTSRYQGPPPTMTPQSSQKSALQPGQKVGRGRHPDPGLGHTEIRNQRSGNIHTQGFTLNRPF